ncbi:MAG: hypothetical protein M3467_08450, partial [Actinomycetota bacterium]|nr:hypothetical protein [Actinomycetota bacterium]
MADQPPDIQSAALLAKRIEAARATMLGLALGDSWSAVQGGRRPAPAGVATQLACATVEGTTRAMERAGHNLSPEWGHATYGSLVRWAAHQGISGVCPGGSRMTDGWLESVPALAERRGNAPSTVAALQAGTSGLQPATNQSMGSHGMVRTLPLGLLPVQLGPWMLPEIGAVAATTHGHP